MRRSAIVATFVLVGFGNVGAGALDLKGSEDLTTLMTGLLAVCPGATGLMYVAADSDAAEAAMVANTQLVAPMGRALGSSVCSVSDLSQAQGLAGALDAVEMLGSTDAATCGGLASSTTISVGAGTYTFSDWTDVLRVLYAGMDHASGSDYAKRDCNSAVRQALVNGWASLFQGACTSGSCTALQHVWRRPDGADSTRQLVGLLGLPPIDRSKYKSPFCNALVPTGSGAVRTWWPSLPANVNVYIPDYQDFDPIRRPCAGTNAGNPPSTMVATEQVCSRKGDLGVVLTVTSMQNLSQADAFPTAACATGKTAAVAAPAPLNPPVGQTYSRCPNGDKMFLGGQCYAPASSSRDPRCLASSVTRPGFVFDGTPVDGLSPNAVDGRIYNAHLHAAFSYQTDVSGKQMTGAYYRMHSTRTMLLPDSSVGSCQYADANEQIGCLVHASPCTLGAAGRQPADVGAAKLAVSGVVPAPVTMLAAWNKTQPSYPLMFPVLVNTLVGWSAVSAASDRTQAALVGCFLDQSKLPNAAVAAGLVPLSVAVCEDFDEVGTCAKSSGNNACYSGMVDVCPRISYWNIIPAQANIGATMACTSDAFDLDNKPNPLTYQWSVSPVIGSFANPNAPNTTFLCTSAGTTTMTLVVSDGLCQDFASVPFIQCGP